MLAGYRLRRGRAGRHTWCSSTAGHHRAAAAQPLPAQGRQDLPLAPARAGDALLPRRGRAGLLPGGFDGEGEQLMLGARRDQPRAGRPRSRAHGAPGRRLRAPARRRPAPAGRPEAAVHGRDGERAAGCSGRSATCSGRKASAPLGRPESTLSSCIAPHSCSDEHDKHNGQHDQGCRPPGGRGCRNRLAGDLGQGPGRAGDGRTGAAGHRDAGLSGPRASRARCRARAWTCWACTCRSTRACSTARCSRRSGASCARSSATWSPPAAAPAATRGCRRSTASTSCASANATVCC